MVIASDSGSLREDAGVLLDRCLGGLCGALSGALRPDAGLWDVLDEKPSAPDHYGQLSAALALRILRGAEDEVWREPLRAWLHTPRGQRGHAPFNRFLLYLLEESLAPGEEDLRRRLAAERRACTLRFRYPSNNWTLLANVCRLLEAGSAARQRRCADRLLGNLERWTTAAGGFIDFPFRGERGATPIAYHHKALLLVAVALRRTGDARFEAHLNRMLAWSAMTWDEAGHAGGLGRSCHALYGDACLLAALVLLGYAREDRRDTSAAVMMRAMLQRWMAAARSDGLLSLNPAGDDDQRTGWDGYMRLTVYNAWAAALLAWAREQAADTRAPAGFAPLDSDPQAGICRLRGGSGMVALVSTCGQPPQAFSSTEAELRYAGGVPFHIALGKAVLCPPALRISAESLRASPALAGWTPLFDCAGVLYALTDFDRCNVQEDDAGASILLEGRPRRLLRASGGGWWSRIRRSLDWRLLGGAMGRREALSRSPLPGIRASLMLSVDRAQPVLRYRLLLRSEGNARVRYLNPGGHALVASRMPERRLCFRRRNGALEACAPEDLTEIVLPAAVRDAAASCLAPVELSGDGFETELILAWAAQDPLLALSRSSSSR